MGVIRQLKQVQISSGLSEQSSTAVTTDDESVTSGEVTPTPAAAVVGPRVRRGLCPNLLTRKLGHRLGEKRGRRTQQRCENDRMLMMMYGIDSEEGEDIPQQGKSYFLDLLSQDNEELLDQFINNEEPRFFNKEKPNRRKRTGGEDDKEFDPEESFLKIGASMRQALKYQLPLGMLEGIETDLVETFSTDPNSEYVAQDLSSFERLLLHATCAYNALNSHSFDFGGKRLVRVENPYGRYFIRDPSLYQYLAIRTRGI